MMNRSLRVGLLAATLGALHTATFAQRPVALCDSFQLVYGSSTGSRPIIFGDPVTGEDPTTGEDYTTRVKDAGRDTRHEVTCCSDEQPTRQGWARCGPSVWAARRGPLFLDAKVALGYGDRDTTYIGSGPDPYTMVTDGPMVWEGSSVYVNRRGCVDNVDWSTANQICNALVVNPRTGARGRMCTWDELTRKRCGENSGCEHNADYIWSYAPARNQTWPCARTPAEVVVPCSTFYTTFEILEAPVCTPLPPTAGVSSSSSMGMSMGSSKNGCGKSSKSAATPVNRNVEDAITEWWAQNDVFDTVPLRDVLDSVTVDTRSQNGLWQHRVTFSYKPQSPFTLMTLDPTRTTPLRSLSYCGCTTKARVLGHMNGINPPEETSSSSSSSSGKGSSSSSSSGKGSSSGGNSVQCKGAYKPSDSNPSVSGAFAATNAATSSAIVILAAVVVVVVATATIAVRRRISRQADPAEDIITEVPDEAFTKSNPLYDATANEESTVTPMDTLDTTQQ